MLPRPIFWQNSIKASIFKDWTVYVPGYTKQDSDGGLLNSYALFYSLGHVLGE